MRPGDLLAVAMAVLVRPRLWPTAVAQGLRLARPGWWRRLPLLPLPDRRYLHFRLVTAYGGDGTPASGRDLAQDVVAWLSWCRDLHAATHADGP